MPALWDIVRQYFNISAIWIFKFKLRTTHNIITHLKARGIFLNTIRIRLSSPEMLFNSKNEKNMKKYSSRYGKQCPFSTKKSGVLLFSPASHSIMYAMLTFYCECKTGLVSLVPLLMWLLTNRYTPQCGRRICEPIKN